MRHFQIYLDMDGVLMDFTGQLLGRLPVWEGRTYHTLPKAEWTAEEATRDAEIQRVMEDQDFWHSMQPLPDAHQLWDWCRPRGARVLTATPSNETYRERCARDKLRSIHHHFDATFAHCGFHAVLRHEKRRFAGHPETGDQAILVDDLPANCDEWRAAGGIAILHVNAAQTIAQLQELFNDA